MPARMNFTGNLVRDPELRFTTSGRAVCNFTVAVNDRVYNSETQEWGDAGDPTFIDVVAWNRLGEHVAESLTKGAKAIVVGDLKQRTYTTDDGQKRTRFEVKAAAVGPDLSVAPAVVQLANGGSGTSRTAPPVDARRTARSAPTAPYDEYSDDSFGPSDTHTGVPNDPMVI